MTITTENESGSEKTYDLNVHQMENREHVDAGENANGGVDEPVEGAKDEDDADGVTKVVDVSGDTSENDV